MSEKKETALAERPRDAAPAMVPLRDQLAYAQTLAQGSLVPLSYRGNPANILVAMGLGQSMGLSPAESLYRINVIQGKPTASAELVAAQVRKAGHKLRIVKDEAAQSVTATIVRRDDPDYPISETRDAAWAQRMGLAGKENYRRQPMTMLTWRAITAVAREACPEALYGVAYTPDEMEDFAEAQPAPQPVAAQASPAVDLNPVRARFKAYTSSHGLTPQQGVEAVCQAVGAASMESMTQEQADRAAAWIDSQMATPVAAAAAEIIEREHPGTRAIPVGGVVLTADAPEAVEPDLYDEDQSW